MRDVFFSLFLFISIAAQAQHHYTSKASQWQLEALGPGSLFSVNFDSRFSSSEKGLGFRIGIGGTPLGLLGESCNSGTQISLPGGLNYLIGKRNHFFELGAGGVLAIIGGTKVYCVGFKPGFLAMKQPPIVLFLLVTGFNPIIKKDLPTGCLSHRCFKKVFRQRPGAALPSATGFR